MGADFASRTKAVWEKRAGGSLSQEQVRQITENLTGFFGLLSKWEKQRGNDHTKGPENPATDETGYCRSARQTKKRGHADG